MNTPAWLDIIFLFIAGVAILQAAQIFYLSRTVRLEFFPADSGLAHGLGDDEIQTLADEIEALGFTLLGVLTEQPWFSRPIPSLTLAWAEHKAFASITRIAGKIHYFYYTPFANGEILLSANGYFGKINARGCAVQSLKNASPQRLWQAHRERLAEFVAQGYTPVADYTPASRRQAARRFYAHPAVVRWMAFYQVKSCLLSSGLLVLLIAVMGIGVFFYMEKTYPPPVTPARTAPPIRANFLINGVQVHHCGGSTDETWVSFAVQNTANFAFQGADILIEDPTLGLVLYGEAPGLGIWQTGFHTLPEQCGLGEQASLPPGATAYLARRLDIQGCTPECRAQARIEMCAEPGDRNLCAVLEIQFAAR